MFPKQKKNTDTQKEADVSDHTGIYLSNVYNNDRTTNPNQQPKDTHFELIVINRTFKLPISNDLQQQQQKQQQ